MRMRSATRVAVFAAAIVFVFVFAGLAADIARAQSAAPPGKTGDYVIRIAPKSLEVVKAIIARDIEVLAVVKGGYLDLLVKGSEDFDFVRSLGQPISVLETPETMQRAAAALGPNLDRYHTYAEMQTDLNALVAAYPSLASLSVMGQSILGKNIYVLKISDNVSIDENEPEVLYMGNHHARELMSVEIPLMFAKYLLANYGSDPGVTAMVNNREIFIAPMINPDGHVYVEVNHTGSSDYWWRKNRRDNGLGGGYGVDLNRNYGYMWGYDDTGSSPVSTTDIYRGVAPFSEPETQAVRDFCAGRNIILALSYHSYGEELLFPWGYAPIHTPDHDLFQALGDSLAYGTGYEVGTSPDVLYLVNGDSDDWAYGETVEKPRFFCFTPEVNSASEGGFAPDTSYIQPTFNLMLPMNMTLLHVADNPYRFGPPTQPVQYAIDDAEYPFYTVRWAPIVPPDPNPALDYDVEEYKNLGWLAQDGANSVSPLWTFDGFSVSTVRKFEGTGSYFTGSIGNLSSHTLQMATFYHVSAESDSFRFRTWYSIESDYDYAYLQASTDGGTTWATVPGNITTNSNPNGTNMGNGITGSSGGWVPAIFPLTAYTGSDLEVRFLYKTDPGVVYEGMYIDLPGPVPTYDAMTLVGSAIPDTTLDITPHFEATFTYRVRARDAENQVGGWSEPQSIAIANVTAIGDTPVLASALGANFPNPFNPTTRIPYFVGGVVGSNRSVDVALRIYNVAGERVATLVNEPRAPGRYEAVWTGRTDAGGEVSSGVYFARLSVDGVPMATRKLVLLK